MVFRLTAPLAPLDALGSYPLLATAMLLAGAGVPLPVSALLVAVGVASAHVSASLLLPICALCTAAAVVGDTLDYFLGRIGALALASRGLIPLARLSARFSMRRHARLALWMDRLFAVRAGSRWGNTNLVLFTSRFVPLLMPLATPISVMLGASRFAFVSFLIWDLLGEMVLVVGNIALGRLLSGSLATPGPASLILWIVLAILTFAPTLLVLRWPRRPQVRHLRRNALKARQNQLLAAAPK